MTTNSPTSTEQVIEPRFPDEFRGDDARLLTSAKALLDLDAAGSLHPHGIGGHARNIINALAARFEALSRTTPVDGEVAELVERLSDRCLDWDGSTMPDGAETRIPITCGEIRDVVSALSRNTEPMVTDALAPFAAVGRIMAETGWCSLKRDDETLAGGETYPDGWVSPKVTYGDFRKAHLAMLSAGEKGTDDGE